MKRKILIALAIFSVFTFSGCQYVEKLGDYFGALVDSFQSSEGDTSSELQAPLSYTVNVSENIVVIELKCAGEAEFLIDVMADAQKAGEFTYVVKNGMVDSVNGKTNAADWSYCWMVYTSDTEMSSTAFGSYEYGGQTLGSANLGVEALPLLDGGIYVLHYQKF